MWMGQAVTDLPRYTQPASSISLIWAAMISSMWWPCFRNSGGGASAPTFRLIRIAFCISNSVGLNLCRSSQAVSDSCSIRLICCRFSSAITGFEIEARTSDDINSGSRFVSSSSTVVSTGRACAGCDSFASASAGRFTVAPARARAAALTGCGAPSAGEPRRSA